MTDDMQRARELLAAEYKAEDYGPMTHEAKRLLCQAHLGRRESAAVRVITAALREVPEGFVMVPVEPTLDMLGAACSQLYVNPDVPDEEAGRVWEAMIAARPQGVK